jgi:sulfur-carrier protein
MPVKIIIPTPLRQYTGKQDTIEIQAKTVGEALSNVTAQYADLRRHLFSEEGKLRSFVNVYLNDEDIRFLEKEKTPLRDNDIISIVPSIAGGSALRCICS